MSAISISITLVNKQTHIALLNKFETPCFEVNISSAETEMPTFIGQYRLLYYTPEVEVMPIF